MKKLFLTLMTLTSVMAFGLPRNALNLDLVPVAKQAVAQTPVKPLVVVNPLVGMIQAALAKVAQGAKSPEVVRLQTLNDAVTALKTGLASIVIKDLAPSDKALLTEACNAMAKEAQDLLTLNTAGDWMPYFIKSPKASVLKLKELLTEIYAMDEAINGRTAKTLFKQYVYRPIMNNKMKSAIILVALLAANKTGVLDLGWDGVKILSKKGFNLGYWMFAGEKYDLKGLLVRQTEANGAEQEAKVQCS